MHFAFPFHYSWILFSLWYDFYLGKNTVGGGGGVVAPTEGRYDTVTSRWLEKSVSDSRMIVGRLMRERTDRHKH